METCVKYVDCLNDFQHVMLVYCDDEGKRYVANVNYYNGKTKDSLYLAMMFKEAVPQEMDLLEGWNYLEDNSPYVYLIPEASLEIAVEDFLHAHHIEQDWKSVDYHIIDNYMELDEYFKTHQLEKGELLGFGILK